MCVHLCVSMCTNEHVPGVLLQTGIKQGLYHWATVPNERGGYLNHHLIILISNEYVLVSVDI